MVRVRALTHGTARHGTARHGTAHTRSHKEVKQFRGLRHKLFNRVIPCVVWHLSLGPIGGAYKMCRVYISILIHAGTEPYTCYMSVCFAINPKFAWNALKILLSSGSGYIQIGAKKTRRSRACFVSLYNVRSNMYTHSFFFHIIIIFFLVWSINCRLMNIN